MYRITTLDEVKKSLIPGAPIGVDTETISLYGKIRLIQFYQHGWPEALFVQYPNPIDLLIFLNSIDEMDMVFQQAGYDVSTIQTQSGSRWQPTNVHDTLILSRLAYPQLESYSLDDVMEVVLGFDPYKKHGIDKAEMQKSKWDVPVLSDKQLTYAAIDVFYLIPVYEAVEEFTTDINYQIDIKALHRALDFQCNGFPVHKERLDALYEDNREKIAASHMPINVNSWQQVRPYLDSEGSDALTVAKIALTSDDPVRAKRALDVRTVKKLSKLNSFLTKFDTEDGRIYGRFAPIARSGRFTCKDQNLEQLPRASKGVFGFAPGEGRVLLYSDYPQLELRTIAAITKERVLIELFKRDEDPHAYVAELLFGKNWTKDDRQVTKTYNFNLLYCGGAGMVQSIFAKDYMMWFELEKIKRDIRKWKQAWPAIADWQTSCIRSHRRGSLKQTPLGRRYRGKLLTDHANIENQGFGADVAKLAMHYMYDDVLAADAKMVNFIHDSYLIEMDEDRTANEALAHRIKEAMQDAWSEACKAVAVKDIPMPAQVMCGYNWGDIEEGDYLFKVA